MKKLHEALQVQLPPPRRLENEEQVEEFAEQVIAEVQKAVDKLVPWAKLSAQAQAWWTLQCAEAVHKAKRLRSE